MTSISYMLSVCTSILPRKRMEPLLWKSQQCVVCRICIPVGNKCAIELRYTCEFCFCVTMYKLKILLIGPCAVSNMTFLCFLSTEI
jgi:hypothetical protein